MSYAYWVNKTDARIQFWIDRGKDMRDVNKSLFRQLETNRPQIEEAAGSELIWDAMPNARATKVVRELPGSPGYASDSEDWAVQMAQMVEAMELFHAALDPYVRKLDLSVD